MLEPTISIYNRLASHTINFFVLFNVQCFKFIKIVKKIYINIYTYILHLKFLLFEFYINIQSI